MGHFGRTFTQVKGPSFDLHFAIRHRGARVLAKMFGPTFHHECFQIPARCAGILEQAPADGAVSAPDSSQSLHGESEVPAASWIDEVFDSHQHRTVLGVPFHQQRRFRPVIGWCGIGITRTN